MARARVPRKTPNDSEELLLPDSASFVESLKHDWKMFWDALKRDEVEAVPEDPFISGQIDQLSVEKLKGITKALSQDRRKLNQQLEKISKEIEEQSTKLESLKLVGGEPDETLVRLNELTDRGQNLSQELAKVNERLKKARQIDDAFKKQSKMTML